MKHTLSTLLLGLCIVTGQLVTADGKPASRHALIFWQDPMVQVVKGHTIKREGYLIAQADKEGVLQVWLDQGVVYHACDVLPEDMDVTDIREHCDSEMRFTTPFLPKMGLAELISKAEMFYTTDP